MCWSCLRHNKVHTRPLVDQILGRYTHTSWCSTFTCVASLYLFLTLSRMHMHASCSSYLLYYSNTHTLDSTDTHTHTHTHTQGLVYPNKQTMASKKRSRTVNSDILVIGAGMSGLYATWRILKFSECKRPWSINIVEMLHRTGGRLDSDIVNINGTLSLCVCMESQHDT